MFPQSQAAANRLEMSIKSIRSTTFYGVSKPTLVFQV